MAEYIDREAAIVDFERCNHENPVWTPQRVKTLLMRIPSADVEPVRHGQWEWDSLDVYRCSACGEKSRVKEVMGDPVWHFCPNCGAKMNWDGWRYNGNQQ